MSPGVYSSVHRWGLHQARPQRQVELATWQRALWPPLWERQCIARARVDGRGGWEGFEGCGGPLHAARGPASGDRLRSLTENELPSRVEDDPTFCGTWIYVALVGVDYTPGLLAHVLRFGGWTPLAPTPVSKRRWARSPRDMHFIHQ